MTPQTNTSRTGVAGRIVAGKSWSAPRPLLGQLLGRGGLVFHVHDLDASVDLGHRLARILELALAVSDGHEIGAGDTVFVDEIALDRVSAALGQVLIVGLAAGGIGMTRDDEGRAFQIGVSKRGAQSLDRR